MSTSDRWVDLLTQRRATNEILRKRTPKRCDCEAKEPPAEDEDKADARGPVQAAPAQESGS